MKPDKAEAIGVGVKTGGKIEWDDQAGFTRELRTMRDGLVVVTVAPAGPKAIRSIRANKYLWQVFNLIAKADGCGQSKEDVHDFMCDRFLKRKLFVVNKQTGETEEHEVARGTSRLSPDEFWDFVEEVRLFAAEWFGLTIPDPDPRWRQKHRTKAA